MALPDSTTRGQLAVPSNEPGPHTDTEFASRCRPPSTQHPPLSMCLAFQSGKRVPGTTSKGRNDVGWGVSGVIHRVRSCHGFRQPTRPSGTYRVKASHLRYRQPTTATPVLDTHGGRRLKDRAQRRAVAATSCQRHGPSKWRSDVPARTRIYCSLTGKCLVATDMMGNRRHSQYTQTDGKNRGPGRVPLTVCGTLLAAVEAASPLSTGLLQPKNLLAESGQDPLHRGEGGAVTVNGPIETGRPRAQPASEHAAPTAGGDT